MCILQYNLWGTAWSSGYDVRIPVGSIPASVVSLFVLTRYTGSLRASVNPVTLEAETTGKSKAPVRSLAGLISQMPSLAVNEWGIDMVY